MVLGVWIHCLGSREVTLDYSAVDPHLILPPQGPLSVPGSLVALVVFKHRPSGLENHRHHMLQQHWEHCLEDKYLVSYLSG